MVIGRMISRSLCWAIMKKMTKKWDLETSNAETEPKIRIYAKNWARQALLKNFDLVKVNGQRSSQVNGQRMTCADMAVWRHSRADMAVRETEQERGARVSACRREEVVCPGACGTWGILTARGARAHEAETSDGAWRCVWGVFWPFLVGFCSGLCVLSLNAYALIVGWAEQWDPRVAGTMGMTAVTRFWQWLLDKGEGSGRTPEMSTGTRKSEEWLWYHVKNIKCEKNWIVCILMCIIMYKREPYIG